jgi:hypothetical protein
MYFLQGGKQSPSSGRSSGRRKNIRDQTEVSLDFSLKVPFITPLYEQIKEGKETYVIIRKADPRIFLAYCLRPETLAGQYSSML